MLFKKQQLIRKYGWIRDKLDPRDFKYKVAKPISLPSIIDLSKNAGKIKDQGNLGSCTACASCSAFEYIENTINQNPIIEGSVLFVYYNARSIEGEQNIDNGSSARNCLKTMVKEGVANNELWHYSEKIFTKKPPKNVYDDGLKHIVKEYYKVNNNIIYDIQHCLFEGFPILCGVMLYESFISDKIVNGVIPMPNFHSENQYGGHLMLIMGYNSKSRIVKVQNSWGNDFGFKGYCYLPFDYITNTDLCNDLWNVRTIQL
jgi:C1A family cysteine protease